MSVTILFQGEGQTARDAREDGDRLWVSADDLEAATEWVLKPVGLCREEACVPLPKDGSWVDADGRIDLTAFAGRLKRPVVRDEEHSVWAFGDSVGDPLAQTPSVQAPDFTLPDLDGEMHSLSDYLGRKIFLYSWGSY